MVFLGENNYNEENATVGLNQEYHTIEPFCFFFFFY